MRKLEITLSEEQYQHIMAEVSYAGRQNLKEETFGGYELCLHVGLPNIFGSFLEMKMALETLMNSLATINGITEEELNNFDEDDQE